MRRSKGGTPATTAGASYTKFPRLAFLKCPTKQKILLSCTRESPFHLRRVDGFVSFSTSSACQERRILLIPCVSAVLLLLSGVGLVFTSVGDAKRVDLMLFGFLAAPQQHRAVEPVGIFLNFFLRCLPFYLFICSSGRTFHSSTGRGN